jgi:hypothetical protein
MLDPVVFNSLRRFRAGVYGAFGARRDALFELMDAATVAGLVPSLAHLSLTAVHRRGWGSLYDALAAGTLDTAALRRLVGRWPLDDGQPVYALDTSVWPRDDAETSPERGYHSSASRQSAGQPIVTGWSYGWLAQLSSTHDSWTAPLDVRRVAPMDDAHAVGAAQIRDLLGRLPVGGPVPLFVFDAGYDPEKLARALGDLDGTRAAVLVRLRSGRCFYADPDRQPRTGRPRRHGRKLACDDPSPWWAPTAEHREEHARYGADRVRAWADVHAKTQNRSTRDGWQQPSPTIRGTLVLVEVERLPRQIRIPKQLWLWWRGPGAPDLAVLRRAYVHRFDLEIVRSQVTKTSVQAGLGRRDHVPDLDLASDFHHAINQEIDQLAALSEAGLLRSYAEPLAQGDHRPGYGARLDEPPPLGDRFTFSRGQLLLSLTECPISALERLQVDDLSQVGIEQPGPLPIDAGPEPA